MGVSTNSNKKSFAIIGGGVCGLSAAYELAKAGHDVTVYEADKDIGGLASVYEVGGQRLEKFYHHWLGTDHHAFNLIKEIGKAEKLKFNESKVGIYYSNKIYRFSSPIDLLKFTPLNIFQRIRFGFSIVYSWMVKDYKYLETVSAVDWLEKIVGKKAFDVIWRPLLIGKFGEYYKDVAAIWMWNKFIQRGKSRNEDSKEQLGYYAGGFGDFLDDLSDAVKKAGGEIRLNAGVASLKAGDSGKGAVLTFVDGTSKSFDGALMAVPVPDAIPLVKDAAPASYVDGLAKVKYLANICLILKTTKSLSGTYWLNVNDPDFPFVGIIEHTNFESPDVYEGGHIVYLSKYLPESAELYRMTDDEVFEYALPYLQRMFPEFKREYVSAYSAWRAKYAQPIITLNYPEVMPKYETPFDNVFLSTMAQVYPEDRGTNYAISEGRKVARLLADSTL